MDRSLLAARIQEILKGRPKPAGAQPAPDGDATAQSRPSVGEGGSLGVVDEEAAFAARCAADEAASSAADVLGGRVLEGPGGACLVVEREFEASHTHGRHPIEHYASAAGAGARAVPRFLSCGGSGLSGLDAGSGPGLDVRSAPGLDAGQGDLLAGECGHRLLFFDLETTGLSGGAGTYAFLVGCGAFDGAAFVTRQFFLRGYGEERALLEGVRAFVERSGQAAAATQPSVETPPPCLVTYNGKAFDLPLIETRYLLHRRTSPFAPLPHVDMLFSARRLWRRRPTSEFRSGALDRAVPAAPGDWRASCSLTALEEDILGLRRDDDVPGWEIPTRYFTYTRTGDPRGLTAVLEHNRLDLLSLAAITAVILEMVVEQDRVVRDRHGSLALGRLLEYLGLVSSAERCYERAAAPDGTIEGMLDRVARAEALHWLALHRRRARRFPEAAEAWRGLLEIPGLDADLRREACEALAIHHEHRAKDLDAARSFALRALDVARGGRHAPDVEHRLDRLSRKLGGRRPADDCLHTQPRLPSEEM